MSHKHPPSITLSILTSPVVAGQPISIRVTASDRDGNLSLVSVTWGDGGFDQRTCSGRAFLGTFTHTYENSASYSLTGIAKDTTSMSGSTTVMITVMPPVPLPIPSPPPINTSANGVLSFTASANHATLTNYTVRLRQMGSSTVVDTLNIGLPTPDQTNTCYVDIKSWLNGHATGNYDVSVAAVAPGGTTDSGISNDFAVPIP